MCVEIRLISPKLAQFFVHCWLQLFNVRNCSYHVVHPTFFRQHGSYRPAAKLFRTWLSNSIILLRCCWWCWGMAELWNRSLCLPTISDGNLWENGERRQVQCPGSSHCDCCQLLWTPTDENTPYRYCRPLTMLVKTMFHQLRTLEYPN